MEVMESPKLLITAALTDFLKQAGMNKK